MLGHQFPNACFARAGIGRIPTINLCGSQNHAGFCTCMAQCKVSLYIRATKRPASEAGDGSSFLRIICLGQSVNQSAPYAHVKPSSFTRHSSLRLVCVLVRSWTRRYPDRATEEFTLPHLLLIRFLVKDAKIIRHQITSFRQSYTPVYSDIGPGRVLICTRLRYVSATCPYEITECQIY